MAIEIIHRTRYRYDRPVDHVVQRLRLTPRDTRSQRVLEWSIETPGIDSAASYVDGFANIVHLTVVEAPVEAVEIVARGRVEKFETHGVEGRDVTGVPPHVFLRPTPMTTPDASLAAFAKRIEGAEPLERQGGYVNLLKIGHCFRIRPKCFARKGNVRSRLPVVKANYALVLFGGRF